MYINFDHREDNKVFEKRFNRTLEEQFMDFRDWQLDDIIQKDHTEEWREKHL